MCLREGKHAEIDGEDDAEENRKMSGAEAAELQHRMDATAVTLQSPNQSASTKESRLHIAKQARFLEHYTRKSTADFQTRIPIVLLDLRARRDPPVNVVFSPRAISHHPIRTG